MLLAAIAHQVNGAGFVRQLFEIQCDTHAISRSGPPVAVQHQILTHEEALLFDDQRSPVSHPPRGLSWRLRGCIRPPCTRTIRGSASPTLVQEPPWPSSA